MISSERDLNESNAALPEPLNLPSNGCAAWTSWRINVPSSVLDPCDFDLRVDSVCAPMSNFIRLPLPDLTIVCAVMPIKRGVTGAIHIPDAMGKV